MGACFNGPLAIANCRAETRLHVKIFDAAQQVYQVPEAVFPRPAKDSINASASALAFTWTANPFSFAIVRKSTNETLFDTSAASLVFESQYLRLRTSLPDSPHLYGLGEHTDPFQLNTTKYTRTVSKATLPLFTLLIEVSCGIVMHTVYLAAVTSTATIPSTLTTGVHPAPMASSFSALVAWTLKLTTAKASSSSITLLVGSWISTLLLDRRQRR